MPTRRRRLVFWSSALLGMGFVSGPWAAPPVSDAAVKAAFVYNFAKFAEWPGESFATPQSPIRICLQGSRDPFLAALGEIDGKLAQNRAIRVSAAGQRVDFQGCHILVVAESERRQFAETLASVQDMALVTVGEWDGFADAGGTVGLVVEDERVRFEVNLESARRGRVKLSSQLLKLARKLYR